METKTNKHIRIFFYSLLTLVIAIAIYIFMFFNSQTDIQIKLEGYVLDETTKQPIENVTVVINNDRFEDDNGNHNYDEYLGHDKIQLLTNREGYYSTSIEKSAFLWIDFQKHGYINKREDGKHSAKKMSYKTYLSKDK